MMSSSLINIEKKKFVCERLVGFSFKIDKVN